jgi:hypothetical protein
VSAQQTSDTPRVLVVEDNPVNRRLACALLAKQGIAADVAADGIEATEAAARTEYDLILMDIEMPRMDGYEATVAIRLATAKARRVPIVAMTARSAPGEREQCLAAGMDDVMTKPVRTADLLALVTKWAAAGRAPSAAHAGIVERLRDLGVLDDPEFLRETFDAFVADSESLLGVLREAIGRGDALVCEHAAHRLKGASLNLGAVGLAKAAAAIEEQGRARDLTNAPAGIEDLRRELAGACASLAEIARGATPSR